MSKRFWLTGLIIFFLVPFASGKAKKIQREDLAAYIQRMQPQGAGIPSGSPGSLWSDNGRLAFLTGDFKAGRVGDLITIVVVHDTTANNANSVSTARTLTASSGITALAGQLKTTGVQQLFSPNSSQALTGKSQASTTSSLQTTLSGRVMAVLSSGLLVVEAERELTMNNEKQTVLVRGLVRTGDIGPDNTVASNAIGNLELELKGKGVLSDGTRPPNVVVRTLLRIIGF
ncbi:MAG: flagellar basal body L-ring protein FlgH [Terriglobales bacterium]